MSVISQYLFLNAVLSETEISPLVALWYTKPWLALFFYHSEPDLFSILFLKTSLKLINLLLTVFSHHGVIKRDMQEF